MDIDVGGYQRAAWRLETEGITSVSFPRPVQIDKLVGQKAAKQGRDVVSIRQTKRVVGMQELWEKIVMDFVKYCQTSELRSIVIDSATLLWNIAHSAHLQQLQEKQMAQNPGIDDNLLRERLQPIEYGPANDRMRMLLHTARMFSKNLVLTHYPRSVYAEMPNSKGEIVSYATGAQEMDGFKETAKLVDVIVWLFVSVNQKGSKVPMAQIHKFGGVGLEVVGMNVPATYQGLINLRTMARQTITGGK